MIEAIRMVTIVRALLFAMILQASQAEISKGVGRFPLLMPNVRPYRVSY